MRPLQVYLDSSDFSVLSSASYGTEADQIVSRLRDFKASGKVDFRFTYAHVMEASPTIQAYLEPARARLRLIEELCWPHAIAEQSIIIGAEARSVAIGRSMTEQFFRDDGDWFPEKDTSLSLPAHAELLRQVLDPSLMTRQQRRKSKKYLDDGGQLTAAGQELMLAYAPGFVTAVARQYPLTDASRAAVEAYAFGRRSGSSTMDVVLSSLRVPTVLAAWLATNWDMASPLTTWLRERGGNFTAALATLATKLDATFEDALRSGLPETELKEMTRKHISDLRGRFVHAVIRETLKETPELTASGKLIGDPAVLAPGLWASTTVMLEVIAQQAAMSATRRNARSSDFGDVAHCLYLPYVDIYRADSFVADGIRRSLPHLHTRVVSKLRDLPAAIDMRLSSHD